MIEVPALLAAVKLAHGIPSNYRLSMFLGVREKDVSRWANGHNTPSDAMSIRLAELAGLDPAQVLIAVQAARSNDDRIRAAWERAASLAERGAGVVACAVLSLCITGGGPDAGALVAGPYTAAESQGLTVDTLQRIAAGAGALTVYTLWRVFWALYAPSRRGVNRPPWASISPA